MPGIYMWNIYAPRGGDGTACKGWGGLVNLVYIGYHWLSFGKFSNLEQIE